jgi:TetR/AcrR family transcriptional regulator, transcriptional repressor for nem operon
MSPIFPEERLDAMFSREHRDNLANGCAMTASGSEIARQGTGVATSFTRAFKEKVTTLEASIKGKMPASQRRELAVSALAAQIGAIAVARAVAKIDSSLSEEVLRSLRQTVRSSHTVQTHKGQKIASCGFQQIKGCRPDGIEG